MDKLKKLFHKNKKEEAPATSASKQPEPVATPTTTTKPTTTTSAAAPATSSTAEPTATSFPAKSEPSTGQENCENPQGVVIHTTLGDITVALFTKQTPKTCLNFATLAASGQYDNVIFHRIIPGFMIQGGDPEGTGRGGISIYGDRFEDEIVADLSHNNKVGL